MFIKRIDLVDLLEVIDCENGYVDIDHLIECCNNLPSSGMSVWCMKCENNGECMSIDKPNCFQPRQEVDRKTENSSEKPNNCDTCKHNKLEWYSEVCDGCSKAHSNYEPKDEPQTETEIAKAIVHKMIDDAVIAEDAYPDLRQRMHEAVERLDEYYPSEEERNE